MNPFVDALDARGYLEAGDRWARLALECAERARECWGVARARTDTATIGFTELTRRAASARSADVRFWESIRREVDSARERAA
jgi:hypothetical protein